MTSPDEAPRDSSGDSPRDVPRDDAARGPQGPTGASDLPVDFDEDAAWRLIVDNYGERAQLGPAVGDVGPSPGSSNGPTAGALAPGPGPAHPPVPETFGPTTGPAAGPHSVSDSDSAGDGARAADEHFVPPDPPPVPRTTPARGIAWSCLIATPLLMILTVVFRWTLPTWVSLAMVVAFMGGFVFLVATMPRDRGDDWDDGAVV